MSGVITVTTSAADNVGVTRVDLFVNGARAASDTSGPFNFSWDSTSLAGSNANLVAVAYDAAGNSATSPTVTISVAGSSGLAGSDTTPPSVAITSPANGSQVSGMINVGVSATDNVGVSTVSLTIDGTVVASGSGGSLGYKWNSRKVGSGMHTISAVARDASGNQATTTIQVTE